MKRGASNGKVNQRYWKHVSQSEVSLHNPGCNLRIGDAAPRWQAMISTEIETRDELFRTEEDVLELLALLEAN